MVSPKLRSQSIHNNSYLSLNLGIYGRCQQLSKHCSCCDEANLSIKFLIHLFSHPLYYTLYQSSIYDRSYSNKVSFALLFSRSRLLKYLYCIDLTIMKAFSFLKWVTSQSMPTSWFDYLSIIIFTVDEVVMPFQSKSLTTNRYESLLKWLSPLLLSIDK